MKYLLGLIASVVAWQCSFGQMYKEGMIVTVEGDTMMGMIAQNDEVSFSYKKDKNAVREVIAAKDVAVFGMDNQVFEKHTVEVLRGNFPEHVEAFLLVVVSGPVNLLEYKGRGLFGGEHVNYYLRNADEVPYRVNKDPNYFKKTMRWYFEDNAELAMKIKKKELGYEQIVEIVNTYNTYRILKELEESSKTPSENQ